VETGKRRNQIEKQGMTASLAGLANLIPDNSRIFHENGFCPISKL